MTESPSITERHAFDSEFQARMTPYRVPLPSSTSSSTSSPPWSNQSDQSSGVFYIPEYITREEESELLDQIYRHKWTTLSNRRLQNHGGLPNAKGMFVSPLPQWLTNPVGDRLFDQFRIWSKKPNHVLVNEYMESQGIDAHKDGPVYEPYVAILSIESTVLIEFAPDPFDVYYEKRRESGMADDRSPFSMILEPRSLLVFSGDVYHHYLHRIDHSNRLEITQEKRVANLDMLGPESNIVVGETVIDRSRRISLTYRVVKKTMSRTFIRL